MCRSGFLPPKLGGWGGVLFSEFGGAAGRELGNRTHCTSYQDKPAVDRAAWVARLANLSANNLDAPQILHDLLILDPDVGYAIIRDSWPHLDSSTGIKMTLLGSATAAAHPRCLDILDLGATDPSLQIQNYALYFIQVFSFQNFTEDYSAYLQWRKQMAGKPLNDVLRESSHALAARLAKADDETKNVISQELSNVFFGNTTPIMRARRQATIEAGIPEIAAGWLKAPGTALAGLNLIRALNMDEAFLRRVVVPLTAKTQPADVRFQAINLLGTSEHRWAGALLLKMLLDEYPSTGSDVLGAALVQTGDTNVVPTLIGMIEADNSPEGQRVLGGYLGQLTATGTGIGRDAGWWRAWWEKNKLRFPPDVSAQAIPQLKLRPRQVVGAQIPISVENHQIGGDPQRAYLLLRPGVVAGNGVPPPGAPLPPAAPNANATVNTKPGLLVVLPGGSGNGTDAVPFWTEVAQKTFKGSYLIALPIAPKWNADQTLIWVTRNNRKQVKEAKFTTEAFVSDVVQDIARYQTFAPEKVFLHGAADSGPAVYACSLEAQTPFRGFYLLASTFQSAQLPPLDHARNRRYYLQHSKDDKVTPYWIAEAAQKLLSEHGAVVKLETYRGNHGYDFVDEIFPHIGAAVSWLEGEKTPHPTMRPHPQPLPQEQGRGD